MKPTIVTQSRSRPFFPPRLIIASACILTSVSPLSYGEEMDSLDDVVVTASRTAETTDETLGPVTVISRQAIERSQASSVLELLNRTPGLQVTTSGGPGSASGIFLRGTKSAQTLVLIDGMKMNAPDSGSASLEFLDPSQIERIEIVRGPRSTLYGADAIGGVIHIFTRQGKGKPALTVKTSVGSRTTGNHSINFGGKTGSTRFNLQAGLFETQGYDRTGQSGDDHAYRNKSLSGSLSHALNNSLTLGATFSHNEGKTEYDNGIKDSYPATYFNNTSVNTRASFRINDRWLTRLNLGLSKIANENKISGNPGSETTTKRYAANWVNDIAWADNQQMVTGVDYAHEDVNSSNNYAVDSRYNVGFYAQNTTTFSNSELQTGLRQDHNEAYGNNTTGNISWGFNLPADMRLIASYGTAFRAPTFADLYFPGYENPDLKAETAQNVELSLQGKLSASTHWSVNAYQNTMKDMLEFDMKASKMKNINKARIRGLELNLTTALAQWQLNTNLTFVNPENRSGDNAGNTLIYRADKLFNVNIDRAFGRWSFGATVRAQSASWSDAQNTVEVPGFVTADLRASVQMCPTLKTELKIVNVLDKEYSTSYGYRDEPRGAFVTLSWTP
ncbi:TonB-dependent receptor domain-containing protein [Candidatus Sororendozoicomonas aggregata]|uniref:TonB-dependent receptor domain-containing protein n=1 Tax=Candidatus Sororendozoicomonas aggregata TaxID=3073239 RepID=UPI002ED18DAB